GLLRALILVLRWRWGLGCCSITIRVRPRPANTFRPRLLDLPWSSDKPHLRRARRSYFSMSPTRSRMESGCIDSRCGKTGGGGAGSNSARKKFFAKKRKPNSPPKKISLIPLLKNRPPGPSRKANRRERKRLKPNKPPLL